MYFIGVKIYKCLSTTNDLFIMQSYLDSLFKECLIDIGMILNIEKCQAVNFSKKTHQ